MTPSEPPSGAPHARYFSDRTAADSPDRHHGLGSFAARVLVAVAVVVTAAAAWRVRDVLLLAFAGVLLALALRAGADALQRRLHWSPRWAFTATALGSAAVLGLAGWLVGDQVAEQAGELARTLPRNIEQLRDRIEGTTLGAMLLDSLEAMRGDDQSLLRAAGFASNTFGALGGLILVIAVGVYLAADPRPYLDGALQLAPRRLRARIDRGLRASAAALRKFLLGQAVAMLAVGLLTGLGLWLLDVPLALMLALIAALLDFVPNFGPILAAVPAVLLAFAIDPKLALYVVLLYLAIQQVEGNVISPLIQERAVALPPALGLVAITAFGFLFGPLGVILGAPLTVMTIALVREWVTHTHEPEPRDADRG